MKCPILFAFVLCSLTATATARAQDGETNLFNWLKGPATGALGEVAQIRISEAQVFAGSEDTRRLMEAMENPTSGDELGFVAPQDLGWFMVFEFDDVGFVKDDEKGTLDAEAMLNAIKEGTEQSNVERRRRGWPTMKILGWEQEPRYNETTHNLEWAIRGEANGHTVINHNTRLLGRGGVMRVTLVTDPEALVTNLPQFVSTMAGFEFKQGHRYAEYRQGDKLAKYGLTALVVGGATAVAVKSGLFKWLWKGLVVVVLVVGASVRNLFGRRRSQQVPHE